MARIELLHQFLILIMTDVYIKAASYFATPAYYQVQQHKLEVMHLETAIKY